MVAKGKASAKRKQQKEEEVEEEKQVKAPKRSKKQEEEQKAAEAAAAAAADEAEASEEGESEEDEGEDGEGDSSSDGEPANTDIFEAELKQREEQLGKHCMVVGALDEEEEEEEDEEEDEDGKQPSLEQLRALARVFVPKKVEEYYAELAEALSKIGGPESEEEDEDEEGMDPAMKAMMAEAGWSFRALSTRHSYPMQDLLKASLAKADKAIKSNKWEDGFCHWAATVQAARRETHWFQDTDVPEVVEAIYEKLRMQWVKLQKRSDEELGGLVVEGAASSKEAFSAFLQTLADELQGMEYKAKDVVKS